MNKGLVISFLVVLPIVSSFITYTFVSVGNSALTLDENQSLIVLLALMKMLLLGSTGVFPININNVIDAFLGRERRNAIYKIPDVNKFPCIRRLLCETEMAARSSDAYNVNSPNGINGRDTNEEINPIEEDPLNEMHIEAVKALFREDDMTSGDMSAASRRALSLVEQLTGHSCDRAYKLCHGRLTGKKFFKAVFEEMHFEAKEEL